MQTLHLTNPQQYTAVSRDEDQVPKKILGIIPRRLSHRYAILIAVAAGVTLSFPSLTTGLFFDDHVQKSFITTQLKEPNHFRPWWDLFYLCGSGGSDEVMEGIRTGIIPWWSAPDLRIAFFRPISVVTHYMDYILWPDKPVMMHLHNLLWFVGIIFGLSIYFRRIMKFPWMASLALLVYCLDDARVDTVAWIAGRNTLITAFFGIFTLISFDRWRRSGWRIGAYVTPTLFTITLLCSEGAIGLWAHFIAYMLFLDKGKTLQRVLALLPLALITLSWRIVYTLIGYGARGSRFYVDPFNSPERFFSLLPERMFYIFSELFYAPSNMATRFIGIEHSAVYTISAALTLILLIFVIIPFVLRNRELQYWCMTIALISMPMCTTEPSTRLLMLIGISSSALIAHCIAIVFFLNKSGHENSATYSWLISRLVRPTSYVLVIILFMMHFLISPVYALLRQDEIRGAAQYSRDHASFFPANRAVAGKTLVILNTPDYYAAALSIPLYFEKNQHRPYAMMFVSETFDSIEVTRPDRNTVRLTISEGFLKHGFSTVLRDASFRFEEGYRVQQLGLEISIDRTTSDGRPMQISLRYPPEKEDQYFWATWHDGTYSRFELPQQGTSIEIPKVDWFSFLKNHLSENR